MNAEKIKAEMKKKYGAEKDFKYITQDLVDAAISEAESLDLVAEVAPAWGETYGNSVFESGGVTYWYASSRPANEGEGCGSSYYSSRYITSISWAGSCPNGGPDLVLLST